MKPGKIFKYAIGEDVNSSAAVTEFPHITTFDFSKNVEGYGFSIRNEIDADLSNVSRFFIDISVPRQYLRGIIGFKTENSGNYLEYSQEIALIFGIIPFNIPDLSSPLKEIVFWFPKKSNPDSSEVYTVIRNIELLQ